MTDEKTNVTVSPEEEKKDPNARYKTKEWKKWKLEYSRRPEVIERQKEHMEKYMSDPEVAERIKQWRKEYYQRPEIREKTRRYQKDRYHKQKLLNKKKKKVVEVTVNPEEKKET